MKKYSKIILFCFIAFSLILGAYYAFAQTYYFNGNSDLCQDLCRSISGWSLSKCSVNFDGDTATGYMCIYSN